MNSGPDATLVPSNLVKLVPLKLNSGEESLFFDLVSKNIVRNGKVVSEEFQHCVGNRMKINFDFGTVEIPGSGETFPVQGTVDLSSRWELPVNDLEDGQLWRRCQDEMNSTLNVCDTDSTWKNIDTCTMYICGILWLSPVVRKTWEVVAPLLIWNMIGFGLDDMLEAGNSNGHQASYRHPGELVQMAQVFNGVLRGEEVGDVSQDQKDKRDPGIFIRMGKMMRRTWQSFIEVADPQAFHNVVESFTEYVDSMIWERLKWSGVNRDVGDYEWGLATWMRRYYRVELYTGRDVLGFLSARVKVPAKMKADPLWFYYQCLLSNMAGMYNDIISLHKELGMDHAHNIFIKKSNATNVVTSKVGGGGKQTLHKILTERFPFIMEEIRGIEPLLLLKYKEHSQDLQALFRVLEAFADGGFITGLVVDRYTKHREKSEVTVEFVTEP